jgi:hypothetical protein
LEWVNSPEHDRFALWGLRHVTIPGFPGTKLNVPTDQVLPHIRDAFNGRGYGISPMSPGTVLWEGDVMRGPGLVCCGHVDPGNGTWRTHMRHPEEWRGARAIRLLRLVLNDNSYDDVMELLDEYPDHVVEVSALDRCYGTVAGRNGVIWEVWKY